MVGLVFLDVHLEGVFAGGDEEAAFGALGWLVDGRAAVHPLGAVPGLGLPGAGLDPRAVGGDGAEVAEVFADVGGGVGDFGHGRFGHRALVEADEVDGAAVRLLRLGGQGREGRGDEGGAHLDADLEAVGQAAARGGQGVVAQARAVDVEREGGAVGDDREGMQGAGGVGHRHAEGGCRGGGVGGVAQAGEDPEADFVGALAGGEDEGVGLAVIGGHVLAAVVVAQGQDAGARGVGGAHARRDGPGLGVFQRAEGHEGAVPEREAALRLRGEGGFREAHGVALAPVGDRRAVVEHLVDVFFALGADVVAAEKAVEAAEAVGVGGDFAVVVAEGEPAGVGGGAVELDVDPGALAGEDGVFPGELGGDAVLGGGEGEVLGGAEGVGAVLAEGGELERDARGDGGDGELAAVGAGLDEGEGDVRGVLGPAEGGVGELIQADGDVLVVVHAEGAGQGEQVVHRREVDGLLRAGGAGGEAERAVVAVGDVEDEGGELAVPVVAEGDVAQVAGDPRDGALALDGADVVVDAAERGLRAELEGALAGDAGDGDGALDGAAAADGEEVLALGAVAAIDLHDALGHDGAAREGKGAAAGGDHVEVAAQVELARDGEVEHAVAGVRARGELALQREGGALRDGNGGEGARVDAGEAVRLHGGAGEDVERGGAGGEVERADLERAALDRQRGLGVVRDAEGAVDGISVAGAQHHGEALRAQAPEDERAGGEVAVDDQRAGLGAERLVILRGDARGVVGGGQLEDGGGVLEGQLGQLVLGGARGQLQAEGAPRGDSDGVVLEPAHAGLIHVIREGRAERHVAEHKQRLGIPHAQRRGLRVGGAVERDAARRRAVAEGHRRADGRAVRAVEVQVRLGRGHRRAEDERGLLERVERAVDLHAAARARELDDDHVVRVVHEIRVLREQGRERLPMRLRVHAVGDLEDVMRDFRRAAHPQERLAVQAIQVAVLHVAGDVLIRKADGKSRLGGRQHRPLREGVIPHQRLIAAPIGVMERRLLGRALQRQRVIRPAHRQRQGPRRVGALRKRHRKPRDGQPVRHIRDRPLRPRARPDRVVARKIDALVKSRLAQRERRRHLRGGDAAQRNRALARKRRKRERIRRRLMRRPKSRSGHEGHRPQSKSSQLHCNCLLLDPGRNNPKDKPGQRKMLLILLHPPPPSRILIHSSQKPYSHPRKTTEATGNTQRGTEIEITKEVCGERNRRFRGFGAD